MLKPVYDPCDDGELSNSIPYDQISDRSHLFIHNFPEQPFSLSAQSAITLYTYPTQACLHPPETQFLEHDSQIDGEMPIRSGPTEAPEITRRQDLRSIFLSLNTKHPAMVLESSPDPNFQIAEELQAPEDASSAT